MKTKKFIALTIAVLTITMAFAPATFAATVYEMNYYWEDWRMQKSSAHDYRYTLAIQQFMNSRANNNLTLDGVFGTNTKNAVISFQRSEGLTTDGIVGPHTWDHMSDYLLHEDFLYVTNPVLGQEYVVSPQGDYYIVTGGSHTGGYQHTSNTVFRYSNYYRWLVYTKPSNKTTNAWYYIYYTD